MNQTKKTLVRVSGIFAIIDAVTLFISGVTLVTSTGYFGKALTGLGMAVADINIAREVFIAMGAVFIVLSICSLAGGIILIKKTSPDKPFETSSGAYKWGCALTIIGGMLLSIAAILLYISFAFKNTTARELRSGEFNEAVLKYDPIYDDAIETDEDVKKRLEVLRKMKQNGSLTDDECREMLFDIIDKKKQG